MMFFIESAAYFLYRIINQAFKRNNASTLPATALVKK